MIWPAQLSRSIVRNTDAHPSAGHAWPNDQAFAFRWSVMSQKSVLQWTGFLLQDSTPLSSKHSPYRTVRQTGSRNVPS